MTLRRGVGIEFLLNNFHDGRSGRAAELSLELHTIPVPGLVTGGNHDAARCSTAFYGERNSWGWSGIIGKEDRDASLNQNFSRNARGSFRGVSRVVSDDDSALRIFALQHIGRNRADNAADIFEREIIRDDCAPTVGAEFN